MASPGTGAFEMTIGYATPLEDAKTSAISDPAWTVVCGDASDWGTSNTVDRILYELCRLTTCGGGPPDYCCSADWENCPDTRVCGLDYDMRQKWFSDPGFRAKYTRHLGGSNLGFADGHAKWWIAEALVKEVPYCVCCDPSVDALKWYNTEGRIRGLCPLGASEPPSG
jgi:prepilin-type processing-associated H-X9-DG protein